MTPKQQAMGELLTGVMEAILMSHRSDFSECSTRVNADTGYLELEGRTDAPRAQFFFEIGSNGGVNRWYVRPVRTMQVGYFLNSAKIAMEILRDAK